MERHPIGSMMQTALENIKDMVDVNTVVGDALDMGGGATVVPISRVCFGFVAGGGEYGEHKEPPPFAGGSGAGVSVQPVGFLVVEPGGVKLLPAQNVAGWERALASLPKLCEDVIKLLKPEQGRGKASEA